MFRERSSRVRVPRTSRSFQTLYERSKLAELDISSRTSERLPRAPNAFVRGFASGSEQPRGWKKASGREKLPRRRVNTRLLSIAMLLLYISSNFLLPTNFYARSSKFEKGSDRRRAEYASHGEGTCATRNYFWSADVARS